jgi:hypothetical protein
VRLETGHAVSPTYLTNISTSGPVRYGQVPGSIGVLESLDKPMPIGVASAIGWTDEGLVWWRLRVHGADIPGRWIIIDQRFVPIERGPATDYSGPRRGRPVAAGDG